MSEQAWRRLHPLMLLVHPVTELGRFLPVLLVAFVFGSSQEDSAPWQWLAVGAPVVIGVVRFLVTRYRITGDRVELRRGLLGRSVLTARLDRVRTVELTASPVHRLLGLARLRIGTGAAGEDQLELDALRAGEARALREELLRRTGAHPPANVAEGAGGDLTSPAGDIRMSGDEPPQPLLALDPTWARYAPFTSSGVVIAGALLAGVGQLAPEQPQLDVDVSGLEAAVLVVGAVVLVAVLAVLAVVGYLVAYGGYVLSVGRSTLHVVRGLFTRRETTLETVRVRGVELHEPLTLRLVGGRRLSAAVTGLGRDEGGSSLLVPPAPRRVVEHVAAQVLHDASLTMPLQQHGPAARRRRLVRAVLGALVPGGGLVLVAEADPWSVVAALALLGAGTALGVDRYHRLGHGLTERYLVTRHDSLRGRRAALERSGIIGWTIRQTWAQRRAGLCTLVATTSAGSQGYRVPDVPLAQAVALADAAVPGLLAEFRSAS